MFGKKKKKKEENNDLEVKTIPTDFYAGANPVIKFKKVEKVVDLNKYTKPTEVEKAAFDRKTVSGRNKSWHPTNLFTNRKFLVITGGGLFVLFIAVAGVYYWQQATQSNDLAKENQINPVPIVVNTNSAVTPTTTSTTTVVATPTQPNDLDKITTPSLTFPSLLLGYGVDLDADQLSDKEEEVFGTQPAVFDTDKDGYSDSHEVFHLYNPAGTEPIKLVESDKIITYTNPVFGYQIYYPTQWSRGNVDSGHTDVLFTDIGGESIEIRVFQRDSNQTFNDWFALIASS